MPKIAILGSGGMGTAMALVFAEKPENHVVLWSHTATRHAELATARENRRYLPGLPLPDSIELTAEAPHALSGAELVVAAIPTSFLRGTLQPLAPLLAPQAPVVSVVKGVEYDTLLRPSQILEQVWGVRPIAALCGPSHAEEFARRLPCSVVVAGQQAELLRLVQGWLSTDRFRVYTNRDLVGVELGGALKNVVAIAAGICDGLEYGDNAKAALLSRGLVEITRLGTALGADADTFTGLAGLGDLIATCCSRFGRNRKVGELIGRGLSLEEALGQIHGVPEGVATCRSIHQLAERRRLDMPICAEVYRVLFEGKSAVSATDSLMNRPPRSEGRAAS